MGSDALFSRLENRQFSSREREDELHSSAEISETGRIMKKLIFLLATVLFSFSLVAKDQPVVVLWPSEAKPVVRFTFGKFNKVGSMGSQTSYMVDVTAENLWTKAIPSMTFEAYFFNKDNVRIGNGYIALTNVGVKESVKFSMPFGTTGGAPVSLKLVATNIPKELGPAAPEKKVRITVYSVPAGATLKVDGQEVGVTPKQVEFGIGKHSLQFSRQGYNSGTYPLEIGPDDVSGGTVSFELGTSSHDTVELRDGSTLTCDIESMDATTVTIRIGGQMQALQRNQVKRILLVQRDSLSDVQK